MVYISNYDFEIYVLICKLNKYLLYRQTLIVILQMVLKERNGIFFTFGEYGDLARRAENSINS